MSRLRLHQTLIALGAALALAGCGQGLKSPIKLPHIQMPGSAPFDTGALESAIDDKFGGLGTCVIIADTGSGREIYRYNSNKACMNPLPPCSTFDIVTALIGIDSGLATPQTVYKWDGSPQPVADWQHDADMTSAFRGGILWWQQRLAKAIGPQLYATRLTAFDYGSKAPTGSIDGFWLGPASGGKLTISPREQAQFLHRLFSGALPVRPATRAALETLMLDETRGGAAVSGVGGDCPSLADGSERVAWWIGRIKGPKTDYVFAISIDETTDAALPAREIELRAKSAFVQAGLLPAS